MSARSPPRPNKTKIEWTDETLNLITGCPGPGGPYSGIDGNCIYCFAKGQAPRQKGRNGYPADHPFGVTFHGDRLQAIYNHSRSRGRPWRIFVDSMGDLFNPMVEPRWLRDVFEAMNSRPDLHFIALTKFPQDIASNVYTVKRAWGVEFPKNLALGVSIESEYTLDRLYDFLNDTPPQAHKVISFEPLMGSISRNIDLAGIDWIIIGMETGKREGKITPETLWITDLADAAFEQNVPVFLKNNLRGNVPLPWNWDQQLQKFPEWF